MLEWHTGATSASLSPSSSGPQWAEVEAGNRAQDNDGFTVNAVKDAEEGHRTGVQGETEPVPPRMCPRSPDQALSSGNPGLITVTCAAQVRVSDSTKTLCPSCFAVVPTSWRLSLRPRHPPLFWGCQGSLSLALSFMGIQCGPSGHREGSLGALP